MKAFFLALADRCGLITDCPNCESAWTGGRPNPDDRKHCVVCGNKKGEITGWVWTRLVDPFGWLQQRTLRRNHSMYKTWRRLHQMKKR